MTRVDDQLFFSPTIRFVDLNFDDCEGALAAFKDRVLGFYLTPARDLALRNHAFASGLVSATTIEFVAFFLATDENPTVAKWLSRIRPFGEPDPQRKRRWSIAERFEDEFRNGLVHEGRIKGLGQFSPSTTLVHFEPGAMIIDPLKLVEVVAEQVTRDAEVLARNPRSLRSFCDRMKNKFAADVSLAKRSSS